MTSNTLRQIAKRKCPMCGEPDFRTVLTLAPTPLGDRFTETIEEAQNLTMYPLDVARCVRCDHTFIPLLTESDDSYSHYLFHSDNSPSLGKGFREIADDIIARHRLDHSAHIVDIGANDGTWLDCFRSTGASLIAVEPAPGPAAAAAGRGLSVVQDYFSTEALRNSGLLNKPPKLVSMNYVFANLPSPREALRDIVKISDESTVISIMTGYHPAQLQVKMFDYVYHEHLSYFTCVDFENLCNELGLVVTYAKESPLKGGSIHVEMKLKSPSTVESTMFQLIRKREGWLDDPRDHQWQSMKDLIAEVSGRVKAEVTAAKAKGIKVIGYGASHSTTTLAYSLGISEDFDFIIDDNVVKHGLYSPGTAIQVFPPLAATGLEDTLVVVLAWQHGPQIFRSIREHGISGRVLMPFPEFHVGATK